MPYTRGAEQSRPAAAVLAEARRLVAQGAREITLLGQNVNAWHGEAPDGGTWGLGRLLRALAELPGLLRLRYATSHPRDMDDDLIAAHRDVPTLMPFLHLPVQSGLGPHAGGDEPQAHRGRLPPHRRPAARGAARHRAVVGLHRRPSRRDRRPISPPRWRWCATVGFAQAYSFKYSPRPGTPAAGAPGQVPEPEKDRRLQELQALLRDAAGAVQRRLRRADPAGAVHRPRPPPRPDRRAFTVSSAGACIRDLPDLIGTETDGANRRRTPQFTVCNPREGASLRLSQTTSHRVFHPSRVRRQGRDPPILRQHAVAAAAG